MVWIDDPAVMGRVSSDLRYRIWDIFSARQIEMAYPQRDVHIQSVAPSVFKARDEANQRSQGQEIKQS